MNAPELLARLDHADPRVRDDVFDRIAASQDRRILEPLAQKAQAHDRYVETLFCRFLENMPPDVAVQHLPALLASPNRVTRGHALNVLDALPDGYQMDMLTGLLDSGETDVLVHALGKLGVHRRTTALNRVLPLLASENTEVSRAAFEAIEKIDSPRAVGAVMSFLKTGHPERQILALNALGRMSCFRKWKRLLPALQSSDASVRKTALLNLSRKAGPKAHAHLASLLDREQDEEVARLALSRMALRPDKATAATFIQTAAAHPDPQVRRSAGWIVGELGGDLLREVLLDLLPGVSEEVQAYILIKMGQRELTGCGRVMSSYIAETTSVRLRYAALEGLGYLRDRTFLPVVSPYIRSSDPMEAYVATLATVQMIDRLDHSPELKQLLLSPQDEGVLLKQVVLQFMIDAVSWTFDDPVLMDALENNLASGNTNVRYLSIILMGRSRQRDFVARLTPIAAGDANRDIRQVARDALNEILSGDLSCILDELAKPQIPLEGKTRLLSLLPELSCNPESAERALEALDAMPVDRAPTVLSGLLASMAAIVYSANPLAVRTFWASSGQHTFWRLCLGKAWLQSLRMDTAGGRGDWRTLLAEQDAGLVRVALQRAVDEQARWALDPILDRLHACQDAELVADMRMAVKRILGF